jgi:hypothetical protein
VTTYTDPTLQTIAEQTRSSPDFSSALGVLGANIIDDPNILLHIFYIFMKVLYFPIQVTLEIILNTKVDNISVTPFILIAAFIALALPFAGAKFYHDISEDKRKELEQKLLFIFGLFPVSLAGFFKAKFVVFTGLMVPLIFCVLIGELYKIKRFQIGMIGIILGLSMLLAQAAPYHNVVLNSINFATKVDVENNDAFDANVCSKINNDLQSTYSTNSPQWMKDLIGRSQALTYRIYCSRVPDSWLGAMDWIRENTGPEERVFSWWDYGHWTNTFGQGKSVTGNTHEYTLMHQEVADKLVHDTPESLIRYMKEHRARYLLLDQDLVGKWGALVYHSCVFNNRTTLEKGPANSECDLMSYGEQLYAPKTPSANDACKIKVGNMTAIKVYSSFGRTGGFTNYCFTGQLPLLYENGSAAGINDIIPQGEQQGYYAFLATYPSDAKDKKGTFYDSVFYKGFFEGNLPGFIQVYPNVYSSKPDIPVRIYKIRD